MEYVIYRHIGELSELNNGWVKELNLISWSDREPVYDIRTWNEDHTKYGKGITITSKQMTVLKELLSEITVF
ncbi:MAG: hypothetical protein HFG37_05195 [Eubacterium sp.]|jgi:Uncharacterized protein conserved in bacteria|nr:hypothetical protein [Eubacterium sp.]